MTAKESPRPAQKRIVIADDHPMTRNGIADWIRREQAPKTVDAHRASIKDKLEIKSVAKLLSCAARWAVQESVDAGKEPRWQIGDSPIRIEKVD